MAAQNDAVVIVGAGQAGAQVAQSLRQGGHTGLITMVGEEPFLPYERPPLSKDYLAGKRDTEQLFLRKADFWSSRGVEVRTGRRVVSVDRAAGAVVLDDGARLPYGNLVWTTGGRPRRLTCEGCRLEGIHYIRSIADINLLREDMGDGERRIVVIGGGYIGLEMAAVLRISGHAVTVLEAQDRLLARVTSPPVSTYFLNLHRQRGVDVRLRTSVASLEGAQGRVCAVRLTGGEILPADLVIVGIGIIPNVQPLADACLHCPDGVAVDEFCRTQDTRILAAGDCAHHHNNFAGQSIRLESVQNAIDQSKVLAGTILGNPLPYRALPWFWSNQYEVKIQSVGLNAGHDRLVLRGHPEDGAFSVAYIQDTRLIALDCIGGARDFVQGKAIIAAGARVDAARLTDPATALMDAVII
jgi:3-phenylpropionate/trans-cinnamate dioxygenase ferredoxin reductase subunit